MQDYLGSGPLRPEGTVTRKLDPQILDPQIRILDSSNPRGFEVLKLLTLLQHARRSEEVNFKGLGMIDQRFGDDRFDNG